MAVSWATVATAWQASQGSGGWGTSGRAVPKRHGIVYTGTSALTSAPERAHFCLCLFGHCRLRHGPTDTDRRRRAARDTPASSVSGNCTATWTGGGGQWAHRMRHDLGDAQWPLRTGVGPAMAMALLTFLKAAGSSPGAAGCACVIAAIAAIAARWADC